MTVARSRTTSSILNETSKLGLAVDCRSTLSLPSGYFGNAILYAVAELPVSIITNDTTSLSSIAKSIREAILEVRSREHVARVYQFVKSVDNIARIKPSFGRSLGTDFALTSWEGNLLQHDFGSLGKCKALRPPSGKFDGLAILLPKEVHSGNIDVVLGLK